MKGWNSLTLGEVMQLEYGKPLAPEYRNPTGLYPAYGANGEKDRTDRFYKDQPSIIVGRKGSAGEITLTEEKYWPLDVTYFAEFDRQRHDLKFLYYLLTTLDLPSLAKGVKPGINRNEVYAIAVLMPPLPEQRRIVAILDESFEGIATAKANAEKNLQNARKLFEFTLDRAIQGRLISQEAGTVSVSDLLSQIETARRVAISQGRAKARKLDPLEADPSDRPELPSGWRWAQLDSLTIGISDGVHKTPRYVAEGVPFVTVRNLTVGLGISLDALNYITREDHQEYIKRTNPERGDILITKDGTIGVVRLIETDVEFSIFVSVALIKPAIRELGPYLAYALRATGVQSQIVPQGAALKHLYLVDLRRLQVPLPPPHIQSRIVDRLDELDVETQRLAGLYEGKLAALAELKKSLLHQAFTGEL